MNNFITHQVVISPTYISYLALVEVSMGTWHLIFRDRKFVEPFTKDDRTIPQDIYFVNNKNTEAINEGEWCIAKNKQKEYFVFKANHKLLELNIKYGSINRKITATTNSSLKLQDEELAPPCEENNWLGEYQEISLPQPSQEWIKYFIENNKFDIITKAEIEYSSIITGQCNCSCHSGMEIIHFIACCHPKTINELVVNYDNTINIKIPIIEPKLYTEQDMVNASKYGYNFHKTTSFPNHKFEDSCINNTKQWLTTIKKKHNMENPIKK